MKKIIGLFVVVTMLVIVSGSVYSGYKIESDKVNKESKEIDSVQFKNKKVNKYKQVKEKGNKNAATVKLNYVVSENFSDEDISNGEIDSKHSVYDVYVDENDVEYRFLNGTNTLCGFRNPNYEIDDNKSKISEKEAVKIASSYIKQLDMVTKNYKYDHVMYVDWGKFYDVYYINPINNIKTDDVIRVWVTVDGEVISYSAFMPEFYKGMEASAPQIEEVLDNIANKINGRSKELGSQIVIDDQVMKYNGEDIVIETIISYELTDGINIVKQQEVIKEKIEK